MAGPLFYRNGYRAIGIDRVTAEAKVAKATFYQHLPSKDDLNVVWIDRSKARSLAALPPENAPPGAPPPAKR